jgi:hypothetical protein
VSGREVVEGQQRFSILGQAGDGFLVFHAILLDEGINRSLK